MNSSSEAEVNSDGLMTTVQPAASAGASFQPTSISGEFHGVMNAHTPTGSLQRVGEVVGPVDGHHGAVDLVGETAVVIEPLGQILGLRVHLRDQLAVVAHLDLGEVLGVLLDQVGDAAQQPCRAPSASSPATDRSRRRAQAALHGAVRRRVASHSGISAHGSPV